MKSKSLFCLPLLFCSLASHSIAAPQSIWSIGTPDESGQELGIFEHIDQFAGRFGSGFHYHIGTDSPKDWPFIHAGPRDAWAGATEHTLAIDFDLTELPAGECSLVIDSVSAQASGPPTLQATVNGRMWDAALAPGPGDSALTNERSGRPETIRFTFPPELLKVGANEVTLTTSDGSWFLYDDVRMENDPDQPFRPVTRVGLQTSPLFANHDGALMQVLWLTGRSYYGDTHGTAHVRVGDQTFDTPVTLEEGRNRVPLYVPEVRASTPAAVTLEVAGTTFSATGTVLPERKWTLFIDPSVHTDIGYTASQADVRKRHAENLDTAMKMLDDNPAFQWNLEVAWQAQTYLEDRPADVRDKFISRLSEGRLGLHAGYLNMLTGIMSDEEMNRYAYYTEALRRRYGITTTAATLTDVPSANWALASALSGSGMKTFAQGINQTRAYTLDHSHINLPFYWEGPDGAKVLTWLSNGYSQGHWLAENATLESAEQGISQTLQNFDKPNYPYDAIYVYGALTDNRPIDAAYGDMAVKWNAAWAYPKIVLAKSDDFFRYVEAKYPKALKVRRGDFGAFWEDGAGSTSRETAMDRRTQRRITSAETLWSLAALTSPAVKYPVDAFDHAWEQIMLYDEHTWGASQSTAEPDSPATLEQWKVKAQYAVDAERATRGLAAQGMAAYTSHVPARAGDVVVANTLSWPRTGLVALPSGTLAGSTLVDKSGRKAVVQNVDGRPMIYAVNVPALGSTVYHVSAASKPAQVAAPTLKNGKLENAYYRINVDGRRGIVSIVDLATQRELVDLSGPYGFGQVVYAAGGGGTTLLFPGPPAPKVVMNTGANFADAKSNATTLLVTPARVVSVRAGQSGPVFSEIVIRSVAPQFPSIETHVRLYNRAKRIGIIVRMTKVETRVKEAVYVAFPLQVRKPSFRFGMTNAVENPKTDFIHGGCHDWYSVEDWVACRTATGSDILWSSPDAPLITLSDINTGRWLSDAKITNGTIFSYVMNNYWFTNYKAGQGGDFEFRYALTSSPRGITDEAAEHFGRETSTDLIAAVSHGGTPSAPPLKITGPGVTVVTVKGAEDGRGTIVRLRNVTRQPTNARIVLANASRKVEMDNLVERKARNAAVSHGVINVALKPAQVATVRVY